MIIVSAFQNTSSELLIREYSYTKVLLPNDKIKDFEKLKSYIANSNFIFCFGQKPNIKNKVCIEVIAKKDKKSVETNFDISKLEAEFLRNGVSFIESFNPGNSFCNELYYKALEYVYENNIDCKIIFIHIPFQKNIERIDDFTLKINNSLKFYSDLLQAGN